MRACHFSCSVRTLRPEVSKVKKVVFIVLTDLLLHTTQNCMTGSFLGKFAGLTQGFVHFRSSELILYVALLNRIGLQNSLDSRAIHGRKCPFLKNQRIESKGISRVLFQVSNAAGVFYSGANFSCLLFGSLLYLKGTASYHVAYLGQ